MVDQVVTFFMEYVNQIVSYVQTTLDLTKINITKNCFSSMIFNFSCNITKGNIELLILLLANNIK